MTKCPISVLLLSQRPIIHAERPLGAQIASVNLVKRQNFALRDQKYIIQFMIGLCTHFLLIMKSD